MSSNISAAVGGLFKEDLLKNALEDPASFWKLLMTTAGALLLLAVFVYESVFAKRSKKKYEHPLPPRCTHGFFKTLARFNSVKFHEWSLELAREQAKILEINLWPLIPADTHFFAVSDPKVARKILENPKSLKPRNVYSLFDGLVGGVCFISEEGERYKHPRKSTLMGISHANKSDMLEKINQVMDEWIANNLGQKDGELVEVDIGVEMQKATIHSIGKIAFGYDFSTAEQEETLSKLVKTAYEFGIASEGNPFRKNAVLGLLWAAKREAMGYVQDIRAIVRKVLETHRSKHIEEQKKVVALNALNTPGKYDKIGGDDALISDMILLYAAGFDTTGYTISFALLELAKHQNVQTELREELRARAKDSNGKQDDCPLLKRVVKETMRLWSVAAGGGARVLADDMVVTSDDGKGGRRSMTLPKDSLIMIATYPVLRDRDVYEQPDEWLPSRWENPTQEMKNAFFPFMVGRRSCPGQLLAQCESEVFLARLVRDYEWTLVKETEPEYTITLKIKGTILQAKKIS